MTESAVMIRACPPGTGELYHGHVWRSHAEALAGYRASA